MSECGAFRFVGLDGKLYKFGRDKAAAKTTIFRIHQPKQGTITKIVGTNTFSVLLYNDGTVYTKGPFHGFNHVNYTLLDTYGERVLDVMLSTSHLVVRTIEDSSTPQYSFYIIGSNEKQTLRPAGQPKVVIRQLPYQEYHKLSSLVPLEVPPETYKVIAGHHCNYALTDSGEVWSIGASLELLGFDTQGRYYTHVWTKLVLPPIVKLVTAKKHTLALDAEGKVHGWGLFVAKEFGLVSKIIVSPVQLFDKQRIVDIETSRWRTTLLTESNHLYIYGGY